MNEPDTAPRLAAIDTATDTLAVAVVVGPRQWCAQELGGARSSQRVLPVLTALLAQAGVQPAALEGVAFGRGPGAFTGLRTACSVAQGFALGAGCPVLSIDSLMIVADDMRARHGIAELWVAMDARMDEVYAGAYAFDGMRWHVRVQPALYTLAALNAAWQVQAPQALAGSAVLAFGDRLACGGAHRLGEEGADRAAALARLSRAAWHRGEALDAALALPLYLRDKVALTTAERACVRAAREAREAREAQDALDARAGPHAREAAGR